jgi:hypothetical protein
MQPFGKRLKRSKPQETGEFLASKWWRRHSTLLHIRQACRSYVLRISTNTMGQDGADFEKGEADGTRDALRVLESVIAMLCG